MAAALTTAGQPIPHLTPNAKRRQTWDISTVNILSASRQHVEHFPHHDHVHSDHLEV